MRIEEFKKVKNKAKNKLRLKNRNEKNKISEIKLKEIKLKIEK